jgi:tRNA(His) 5'-end guanylyltransferase
MKVDELEARMRQMECYHALRIPPGVWPIIRVDGRSFSRLTEQRFSKPFDDRFRDLMIKAAESMLVELQALYAYTESDEISLLLPREWALFDREVEKTVSVSAGVASAAFTLAGGEAAHFDSRLIVAAGREEVEDYFRWRQADAARCSLNGWCYWTLRNSGQTVKQATAALERLSVADKNELLFQSGINYSDVPSWQKRGIGLYWEVYDKPGVNPLSGQEVVAQRRRVKVDLDLPMKEAYAAFLHERLG